MIQNCVPEAMRLNKLSKVAEEMSLPRSVSLPPLGGESFDIDASDMSFVQKLHSDYLAEVERSKPEPEPKPEPKPELDPVR